MTILVTLHSLADRERAKRIISEAIAQTRVEIRAPRRTNDQNARMWAMLSDVADQHEHYGRKLEKETWKIVFLTALGHEVESVPTLDGTGMLEIGTSSSKLSKEQMSDLFEFLHAWGVENEIVWNDPKNEWADSLGERVERVA